MTEGGFETDIVQVPAIPLILTPRSLALASRSFDVDTGQRMMARRAE